MEKWVPIKGWEECYTISTNGEVCKKYYTASGHLKSFIAKPFTHKRKSPVQTMCLQYKGKKEYTTVAKLVATNFIPNPQNKPLVCHKDNNPLNNHVDNLLWCTFEELHNLHPRNPIYNVTTGKMYNSVTKAAEELKTTKIALKNYLKCKQRFKGQQLASNYEEEKIESLENEIWKQIPDTDNQYEISNFGRVKSISRVLKNSCRSERLITTGVYGNRLVAHLKLYPNGKLKRKQIGIAKTVAKLFLNTTNFEFKDNNIENCAVSNLKAL